MKCLLRIALGSVLGISAIAAVSSASAEDTTAVPCFYLRLYLDNPRGSLGPVNENAITVCKQIFLDKPADYCDTALTGLTGDKLAAFLLEAAEERALRLRCDL